MFLMRGFRNSTPLALIIVWAFILPACAGAEDTPEEPDDGAAADEGDGDEGLTRVELAVNNPIVQPGLSFMWVGDYFGWYEDEGIDLEITTTQGAADSTQRLIADQIDIGVPPPSMILRAVADGQDPDLVSVYCFRRSGQYAFAVSPDSDIETIEDLAGRRVGVSSLGDEGLIFTEATARELGLEEGDIEIIAVGAAGEGTSAMEQGNVDALALPGAQYAIVESLGVELRYLPQPRFAENIFGNQIVVRRDLAEENPELIEGFLRVFAMGTAFFMENPEAALEIHFEMFPETIPSGLSLEEAIERQAATLDASIATMRFDDKECQLWGCNVEEEWEAYIDYLGLTVGEVGAAENHFTNDFLDYANDFDQEEVEQMAQEFQLDG